MEIRNDSHLHNNESSDCENHKRHTQFLLSRDILLVSDPIIWYHPYLVQFCSQQAPFTRYVICRSCDLVTCLQAVSMQYHRDGPEHIFPSSGWTNLTLDP
jgi:hypothetical protein